MTEADAAPPEQRSWTSRLTLPEPLRRVFAQFPLRSYAASRLPQTAPQHRNQHVLYSFQRSADDTDSPSCNPTCLKWQALLKFHGIQHRTKPSNNHASPSGSLPFILPAAAGAKQASPVSANKIPKWIVNQGGREEKIYPHEEAYTALVDHDIRNAWLYFLYLDKENYKTVAWPLYCSSASSSYLVQAALGSQLQSAAQEELLKSYSVINPDELYDRAADALQALATQLGDNEFFFGAKEPGLFDASVFAYVYLLLDENMRWANSDLIDHLRKHPNLVEHRERLVSRYFP